jgi:uncharacterized protein HemX
MEISTDQFNQLMGAIAQLQQNVLRLESSQETMKGQLTNIQHSIDVIKSDSDLQWDLHLQHKRRLNRPEEKP